MMNAKQVSIKPQNRLLYAKDKKKIVPKEFNKILLFTLLHLPFGLLLYKTGSLGILHPLGVFFLGMYWAAVKKVKLELIAYLTAYLIGCEVLWRMAETPIFWEFGKYGSAVIMISALLKRGFISLPVLPVVYLAMLIPACVISLTTSDLDTAKANISFNLSGPFALFAGCWFFSHLSLNKLQIRRFFLALAIPLLTVAATTLFYTVSYSDSIVFGTESNFATSGGFGPNQVSSMLGLGAFISLVCILVFNNTIKFKLYFMIAAIFLVAQSVLTFSRGGVYSAIGALGLLILIQLQNPGSGIKKIIPVALIGLVFYVLVFPFLNNFTGGKLLQRFEDTGTTNRTEIVVSDLQILAENPIFGVGLGEAKAYREKFLGFQSASHTEFSRLISEHGVFGVFSILALILMVVFNFLRQNSIFGRALVAGFILWCCLFMLNAGMRLAAPSILWGFSFVNIIGFQRGQRKTVNHLKNTQPITA